MQKAPIQPEDRPAENRSLPLSQAQTGVWRAQKLAPREPLYNIACYVEVFGAVERRVFEDVVLHALRETESALFTFIETDGEPRQIYTPVARVEVPFIDFSGGVDPEAEALQWMRSDVNRPFDLAAGPLIRFVLLKVSESRTLWLSVCHHLVMDLLGAELFLARVAELYTAAIGGQAPPSAEFTPWSEVIRDEEDYRASARYERDRSYWTGKLRHSPPPVTLSGQPPAWLGTCRNSFANIPRATIGQLEELGNTCRASLAAVLFAAVAVYIAKVTAQSDLVLGMPVSARTSAKLRRTTGFVANVVPLRLQVDLADSFTAVVQQVGVCIREAFRHQRYWQSAMRSDLGIAPHEPNPYGVFLNFLPSDVEFAFPGRPARLNVFTQAQWVEDLGVAVHAHDDVSDVLLQFIGHTANYSDRNLHRHLQHFVSLLERLAGDSGSPLRRVPLVDARERQLILEEWSGTTWRGGAATLVELFEAQVARNPDAVAVVCGSRSLSYAELDARSSRLAQRLIERGVGPECVVGLWADRSLEMVIGMLGVLQAGAAYLPLDPAYPAERLRLMLEDVRPMLLLGSPSAPAGGLGRGIPRLAIESVDEPVTASGGSGRRRGRAKAAHPAYLIYTSGSSGIPKGVVVTHAGLSALAATQVGSLGITRHSRVLQFSSLNFDASVWETLMALAHGAALVLAPMEALSGAPLRSLLAEQRITHATLPPAVLATFTRGEGLALECLVVAGEACPSALVQEWSSGLRMINAYGPTESTVCATMSAPLEGSETPPIGTAVAGTRVYVLDAGLEPVPVGVAGELYISSVGLARGYLKRSALTAERFVADPYGEPGSRMYRSGDVVRWREDGALEYLGRADQQVKLRGHRIELGEIEAALYAQPEIEQAAVVVRDDMGSGKALVAYLVGREGRTVDVAELRRSLSSRLPQYMVPTLYVTLATLPLTPSGKVDRQVLPASYGEASAGSAYEAPVGAVETGVAAIWAELLKVGRVGRYDNFFEMGGNSLLLVELIDRLGHRDWRVEAGVLFDRPTVAGLAAAIEAALELRGGADSGAGTDEVPPNGIPAGCAHITPDMLPLVRLDQDQIDTIVARVAGGASNVQDIYPLAPLQEGILIHHRASEHDAYALRVLLSFASQDLVERFVAALQAAVDRHDALRTAVQWEGLAEPLQVVWRAAQLKVEQVRVEQLSPDTLSTADALWNLGLTRLEVTSAPIMRVYIAPAAAGDSRPDRRLVLVQVHHIVADHTSQRLLWAEAGAHMAGRVERLPAPVPFRDFVAQAPTELGLRERDTFFREMLAGLEEPTAPFGVVDIRGDGSGSEESRAALDSGLSLRVRELARRHGIAVSSLFHLAWGLVLGRMSARQDVIFGTVLFGRMQRGIDAHRAVGLYVNTLPLRLSLAGKSVTTVLREIHARLGELIRHERASLTAVQQFSAMPAGTPLFSTLFNYRQDSDRASTAGDSEFLPGVTLLRGEERTNYPLTLSVEDRGTGFSLKAQAVPQIGAERTCRFMVAALESLTTALERAPETDTRTLQVLPTQERNTLLGPWSGTTWRGGAATLVELFEAQVARNPDAVAVVCGSRSLSYAELNARSSRLAQRLIERGVGPECVVGLWADRSLEMVIGMLGVLQAGGAYLPLDPAYPAERLRLMLEDVRPILLLGSASAPAGGLGRGIARLIIESVDEPLVGAAVSGRRRSLAKPAHPAYVIYTSGSTGIPKGVVVTNAGLNALAAAQVEHLHIDRHSRVLQFASLNFDASVSELLMTLSAGAALVLAPAESLSGPALRALLVEQRITHATLPPAVLGTISRGEGLALECLLVAGEACPPALVEEWSPGLRMINAYGPTESTVCATMSAPLDGREVPPIGKPIKGTQIYVLDAGLEPVPIGVAGELYISGVGLARGYMKRPAVTAERFVADPYGVPGSRMYRSGDVVRWREDGVLEYLGRADQQVKVRGHRIELAEIEAALYAHPEIEQAAAAVCDDRGGAPGGKALAAYLVGRAGKAVDVAELRRFLSSRLPQYMVPTQYVLLDALPLSPNGKLDRQALPAPENDDRSGTQYEPPRTPTEIQLAAAWCEILRVGKVGRYDDFFASGGHSLHALQVVARVRDVFALELSLKTLFDFPTLEALATQIDRALAQGAMGQLAPIVARTWDGPAPLSYSQERMWLIQSLNPATTAYNMGGALRIRGSVDVAAFSKSYDELLQRHEILRTRVRLVDEQPVQIVDPWSPGTLSVVDLRSHPDAESAAMRRIDEASRALFDLNKDPVVRVGLFITADDSALFAIVLHHIAGDQWSMGVFGRELATLYGHRQRGTSQRLEPLPVSYRDYAHWQRSEAFAAGFERQLGFWRRQLADLPTVDLPVDYARPRVWTMSGAAYQRKIPARIFAAVGELARSAGSTMFMTCFAGFATLLHRISGQADLPIGVPVANRTHSSLEGLMGTFVNTVVMRTDVRGDPAFRELLGRVRATALDAFANQDISFDRLVQELGQRGDRSRAPLVQVLFNVTNAPMHGIELDGLTVENVVIDRGGAQFELTFTLDTEFTHEIAVEYNTDLFERATIERMVDVYFTLLESAAAAPQTRLSRLSMLPAEQWERMRSWNATDVALPAAELTFPRMFAAQVERSRNEIALTFEGSAMTYGELDARATALACALRVAGARPGAMVAVCVARSSLLVIGLLAVQKSGAAYVPLDPGFPVERLAYMLSDSGAKVVLTSGALPAGLEVPAGVEVIDVAALPVAARADEVGAAGGAGGAEAAGGVDRDGVADLPRPLDAAYVLYTSGSTGRPKGVTVSHGALANFLLSMRERPGLTATDVVAAVTTVSFDIAGLELYLPLIVGARIELVSRQVATDGAALAELLDSAGATLLQATPATWRMLIDAQWRGRKQLRALCGGEALAQRLADEILERVGELWNMYGPTETTIWSTLEQVERGGAGISIGRPIANTTVYIMDPSGGIAPIGVAGEICIGGAGVATGYHRRPALTAERFIADAYTGVPGARLYKTGDLGRWGADGRLYHLGRADTQVKIRGFRIELGEVEQALATHPAIQHAVAAVREAQADDPRLVAYVIFRDGEDATISELKRFLRSHLPDYMIPSLIVPLQELPLTANGKVDRKALPDPFVSSPRVAAGPEEALASGMERVLAEIWKTVLKVDRVAPHDNFFELGGYSLLSLRVAKLVDSQTGRRLDPRALFFHNLREVAGLLDPDRTVSG